MYIRYTKLWKLLIERGMKKTDLIDIAGINSRTLAKLSKDESVTTDTLIQICEALGCKIEDILETCEGEASLSIYEAFNKHKEKVAEDEYCITYAFPYKNKNVLVRATKARANKHTFIKCNDNGSVSWIQNYRGGYPGAPIQEERIIATSAAFWKKDTVCILLVSGRPCGIDNLDEGWFVSSRGTPKSDKYIYVMSQAAFKLFNL